jgi:hypothetical protein
MTFIISKRANYLEVAIHLFPTVKLSELLAVAHHDSIFNAGKKAQSQNLLSRVFRKKARINRKNSRIRIIFGAEL